jgi:D-alanyl-D-alanine carboxypeptidase/D-alanyl-D-alanine-endopeptidase (penicillin-binding protein 4)
MVEEYAADMGVDTTKVLMSDGSGLSDQDLINTDAITQTLLSMRKQPLFTTYKNSLSTASLDGTLENRFWDTPLKAKINGNFGFHSGIAAFSGYLTTSNNHLLMFSIITNHVKNHKTAVIKIEDKILELLYQNF